MRAPCQVFEQLPQKMVYRERGCRWCLVGSEVLPFPLVGSQWLLLYPGGPWMVTVNSRRAHVDSNSMCWCPWVMNNVPIDFILDCHELPAFGRCFNSGCNWGASRMGVRDSDTTGKP